MAEKTEESLPRPEEGPRYKILVFQLNPGAEPQLQIAEGLFGSLEGKESEIKDFSHLVVSELAAPTAKEMPDIKQREEEADWRLKKPEEFFREPLPAYGGIIITGSPFMAYPHENAQGRLYITYWKRELYRYLREAINQAVPILGICYGAQILAEALGGKTGRLKSKEGKEVWEWGWSRVKRAPGSSDDLVMRGLPSEFVFAQNHKDGIFRLPEGAVLLAENEYGVQGFRVDDEKGRPKAWGFQFHPERPARVIENSLAKESHRQELKKFGLNPEEIEKNGKQYRPELAKLIFTNFLDYVRARI